MLSAVIQRELYFLKRHTRECAYVCACSAIIFRGLRKRLRLRILEYLRVRLRPNYCDLRCPPLLIQENIFTKGVKDFNGLRNLKLTQLLH